mgnify:FL=1
MRIAFQLNIIRQKCMGVGRIPPYDTVHTALSSRTKPPEITGRRLVCPPPLTETGSIFVRLRARHRHFAANLTGRRVQLVGDEIEPVALIEGPPDFVVAEDLYGQWALE